MERRKFIKLGVSSLIAMPYVISRNSPVFGNTNSSQIVSVFDQFATSLNTTPGKIPNEDNVIVDKVLSFSMDRTRVSNMLDTAVLKITGKSTVGKAWESLFPAGHPTKDTTISMKINMSFGNRNDENDWSTMYCPFGAKAAVSDAIVAGLSQMLDGNFPVENITIFDVGYASRLRKGFSMIQGYRPVQPNSVGLNKDDIPGTYKMHWVNPRNKMEIPSDAPKFIAAPDFAEEYKAPQTILPPAYQSDFMINLSNAKNHREAGVTGAMKNTYGCTNNPVGTHGTVWRREDSPYAGTRLCIPVFYKNVDLHSPCILNVLDAIAGLYHGGPLAGKIFHTNSISVSQDPVALDSYVLNMVNKFRAENGYDTLSMADGRTKDGHPNAPYLRFASEVHGLGSISQDDSNTFDQSSAEASYNIPTLDKSQSRVSDVVKRKDKYQLEISMDDSKRNHEIESRIEDPNWNVVKYVKSQSTKSSKTTIQWDHRNEDKKTVDKGIFVWHVKVDGVRHTRIINDLV